MKVHISKNYGFVNGIDIYILDEKNGKTYLAKPMMFEFQETKEGEFFPDPTLRLDMPDTNGFLKAFADALEEFGIFRKQDPDAMKYIQNHLNDMRNLVFKKNETK